MAEIIREQHTQMRQMKERGMDGEMREEEKEREAEDLIRTMYNFIQTFIEPLY